MIGWLRQLTELRDALRALPSHLAEVRDDDGQSIRDRVQEIESSIQRDNGVEERSQRLNADSGAVENTPRSIVCRSRRCEQILCDRTHESSFHVADPEAATSGDPAIIMAGTPDTDPSGAGASVEGPATPAGLSTSDPAMTIPTWTFGDRLRKARRFRGMDQRTLAQYFDVSPSMIGLWEKNRHLPRNIAQCAQELQQILRVPAWWLLGLSKP